MKRAFAAALSAGLFYAFYAGTQAGPMAPGDGGYMSAPSALRALASPAVLLSTQVTPSSGSFVTATPVLFAWTGPSTAAASQLGQYSGFVLQVDETADFLSPLVEITTSPEMYPSSPTVNGEYLSYAAFLHDATYYWRVGIYDGSARSTGAWSQAAPFRTDFTAPGMPADFASMQAGTGTLKLSWTSQGDDGGLNPLNSALYKVQYSTYGSVAWSTAAAQVTISTNGVLPGASQYYRLENLAANTSYYARLWVFDDAGTQAPATGIANAATFIEFPESVYVDEVGTTTILASAYAPAFTNLDKGYSGVNITTGAQYGVWGSSGSYWTTKRNMNGNHEYGGAAGIGGKVYIVGDGVSDTVLEEYDPVLNNWTTKSPLVPGRRGLAAAALGGKMYVAGGTSSGGSYFLDLAEYNPELNIWTVRAPMPGPRNVPAAAAAGGKLYVFGGYDGGATRQTTYEYDPAADSWSGKQDMPGICANAAAAPARGYLYVAGCGATKLYRYDPVNNNWSSGADLPTARQALGVAAVGGKVYALGGSNGVSFSAAEVYDPLTGIWTVISSMPAVSNALTAAAAGGRVYALGGSAGMNSVFEYTPGVSKLLTGLQPNTQYTLRALARNQFSATGGESQQVSTYTLAAIAQHPSLPLFGSVSSFSVTVAWSSGTAAGGYNGPGARYVIQASTDAYFRPVAASSDTANIFVALGGLLANTTYYFRAKTFNAGGMTDHSWTVLGAVVTQLQQPASVYIDEVSASSITASAYAPGDAFSNMQFGQSGVAVSTDASFDVWSAAGNTWIPLMTFSLSRYHHASAAVGGKLYVIGGNNGSDMNSVEEYDPAFNIWTSRANLPTARQKVSAASVRGRIYAVGGVTAGNAVSANTEYDPAANQWAVRKPMSLARMLPAVAAFGGKVYAIGGDIGTGATDVNEEYDPDTDTWTNRAALPQARAGSGAVEVWGKIYVVGGYNAGDRASNYAYDPALNSWAAKASMPTARESFAAAAAGGKVYAIGGYNAVNLATNEVYDPEADTWTVRAPMLTARRLVSGAALAGRVYVFGGIAASVSSYNEVYDPGTARTFAGLKPNTLYNFAAKSRNQSGLVGAQSLPWVSTYTLAAVAPSTGAVFTELAPNSLKVWWSSGTAAGGYNGPGASYRIEYATAADFGGAYWTQPAPDSINALLSGLTANTTYHFRVRAYNAGGMTDYSWRALGSTVTSVEQPATVYMDEVGTTTIVASAYAPGPAFTGLNRGLSGVNISLDGAYGVWGSSGNYWTTKAYMNVPRWGHGIASGGGKIYAVGGSGSSAYFASVEVYDPALNAWSTIANPMNTARRGAAAAVIGRKLYVAGGNNGANLNLAEAYDIETGVWSPRAPMPTARYNAAAGAIGGKLYVVGGQGAVLLNVNEAYDPALDSWSGKTGMNVAREGAGSGVIGSMLYVAGGNSGGAIAVNEEYDAIADTWTTRAPMNFARYRMAGAAAGGKFYAFGGFSVSPLKTAEAYDPAGNTWTRLPDMSFARADLLAAGAAGGRLYVAGGYGAGTMGETEEYTPGAARVFAGLQPNTPHSFAAKARNQAGGVSPESAVVSTHTMAVVTLSAGDTFSGVTSAGATIYWSSGTGGITGFNGPGASYKLQASTAADFTGNKITSSTIATSAFLDLAANTSYYFRVQAFNAGGMTDHSWLFLGSTVTTVNQPLPAPAAAVGTFTITAAWNPNGNSPDTVYTAQISSFATFTPVLISSVVTSTSVVFGPLAVANTYYYLRVNAVNRSGSATAWTPLGSTVTAIEAVSSMAFVSVSSKAVTVQAVSGGGYTWLSEELSGIDIAFEGGYGGWTKLDSAGYTGLQPNKSYSFKARSRNRLGAVTPESAEFSTWTLAAVAAPAGSPAYQSVWLSSAVVAYSSGTAAWGFNASTASYLVEADTGGNFDGVPVSSRTVALTAALELSANATWYFRARAYNAMNVPGEWALFGSTATQIETPTGIKFTAVGPNGISLQVQGTPGFSNLSSGLSSIAKAKNGVYAAWFNSTADTYSGLTPNTQYAFSAKARNLEGRVTPEITVSTWTLAMQPGAAAGFYDAYANSLWFGWSDGGNPAGTLYRAEVSTASDYSVIAASSETLNVYASLTALQANTTYYGRVAAVNGAGVYSAYLAISATSTRIETPASVQAEEVWVSSVAVRALDSFSGLDAGLSGLSFAKDGAYGPWLQVSTASFTGLLPNTLYAFKARARNQAGILTAQSPSLSTVTLAAVTPAQDGATWLSVHQSSVAVAWSSGTVPGGFNGSGAKYKLQASTSADFTGSQVSLFPVTQVSTSVTGLQSNTTYFFRVQAYNFNNVTDGSWLVLGTTVTMAIPPAASGTPFVQVWHEGVEPAWSANGNSDGTAYRLQVSSFANFSEVRSTVYPLYVTTSAVGGLAPNTTWYARAAAVSYSGAQTEYYVIGGTLTPMAAPTDVLFPAVSSLTITAEAWSSYGFPNLAEGQSGLAYWRAGQGWTPWTSASSSVVSGLAPNTRYDIKAKARGQSGLETAESPLVSTYTLAAVSLPQQGPLYEDLDTNMLTVHWSSGTEAEGFNGPGATYRIVSAASGDFAVSPQSYDVTDLFRPFVGLSANTTYYHKVRAYNSAGVAGDWLVLGATATLTGKPGSVAIAAVHPTSVTLTWAVMGAASSGYLVQASTLAGFTGLVRASSTPNGFLGGLTVTGLLANTSYFLRVGSLNHGGTPNFEAALSTMTPAENEPPTITDMELGTDYSWYSALPARTYNINFFDTGGSALENFQVRATTGPLQTGTVNADWTDIATGLDVDSYTADWPLTQGAWDLLADGTNYISVQVFDGSGNKDVREDAFIVFKDSTPPAISHGFDGSVWRSTFGFTVPLQFSDEHSRVEGAQVAVWTSTGLTGVQLWPWTSLFSGADAHQRDENLVMAEAGWNLLAPGTNYFSLRAGDYSLPANTTTWADAFVILKDTSPPAAIPNALAVSVTTWTAGYTFSVPADYPSGAAYFAVQYATYSVSQATYSVSGSTLALLHVPGVTAGTGLSDVTYGLSANTTYFYSLRAGDLAGNWSVPALTTGTVTLAEAPAAAAPQIYYSSAALSWGAVFAAGYAAHASTAPDFSGTLRSSFTSDGGAAGLYVAGLTPNTTYYLRAASLNWAGAPNYSAGYEGVTLAVVPGSAAVYSAVSSVTAAVEWLSGGNSAGTSYLVGISSDGHVSEMYAVPFSSAGPGPYRHKFTGLQPNTTYWFRVLAQGHGGDFTDWLTLGSTMTLPVPPNLTSYEAWESSAAVAWDANGNGAGTLYQLDLSTDALFAPVEVTTVTQGLSFAAGLQLPDTTHYLRLRSLSSGSGQASAYAAGEQVSRAAAPQTIDFYNFGANSVGVYWNGQRNQGGRASGAWTQSGALPSGLHGHAAVVAGDLLVVTGGSDGTGYQAKAWAARLEHDGTLGSWTRTRDLPGARYGHASFFAKGRIYVLGGYDGSSARAEVWSAPLSSSGALGEWREEAPLSQPVYAHGSFGLGDRIYVLGGYNGGARDEAYFADPAADGAIASWTPAGNLPAARYALAAAVALSSAAPRLCVTGGSDGALARSEAWTAAINGDGTLGGWTAATPLPNGLFAHAMTPYNGALFVLGGNNGSGARTAVLRAAVRYDGSIGPWEAQPSLPQALQSHAAGDRYGRLLALGGYDGAVSRSALYQAPVAGAEYSLEVAGAQFSSAPWSAAGFAQVGSLAPNTLYGFRVKARNSAGAETPYSAQFTTRTYASQPSTAAFGGIYMSSVQVNWIGHDNPAGTVYDVQLSSDAAHTLLASSRSVTTVGHLFTGLDQDHLYYARVRAVNDGGTATAWTALGSTTTRTDPSLDLSSPVITVNQAGDAAWRNAGGALYDLDITDAGGAYLQRFEVRASTSPAGQPPQTAWATVAGGLETAGYSDNWALPAGFFDLLAPGTNYISVRAWDHNGNSTAAVDAFYVLKDTEAPVITDGQAGEDFWRMDDAGAAYDVDFADGLSGLAAIEYSASPNQGSGDAAGYGWTQIAAVAAGTAAYTADWGVNFAQLPNDATNFISVRARDRAGNTAAVTGIDVFKVLKYVAGPEVWMTSPSAAYHSALAAISGTSSDARSHAFSGVEVSLWSAQDAKYWNGAGFLGSSPVWFAAAGTATWSWNPGVAWQDSARYEAVARASDTAGNYSLAFATRAFYFDIQSPVVAPASPSNGETVNSVPALSGSASDLSGISALSLMFRRDADGKWWDFDAGTWTVSGSSAAVAAAANWVYTPPELLKASLENGGTYYYTLYAADNSVPVKVSTFGATGASFLFVDNTAPGAITDLYASTGNAPGNISLSWSAAGDDGGSGMILYGQYRVEYSTSAANAFSTAAAQAASDFTAVSAGSARTRELTGLVAGETYYLRAWTRDDAGNWSALSNGATAQAAPFPDRISGRVMTVSSAGITGVLVEAFDTDGALKASAYTLNDGSGSYVLAPLAAGSYRVQATWEAEEIVSSVGTEGFALGRSDADFRLSIGYELAAIGGELAGYRLTVSGRRALAAGTARVQLFQRGRMVAEAPVDAAGRFRLRGLLPGKYTLRVPAPEGGYKEMSVRVKAGEALVINPLADLLKAAKVYVYPNPARNTVKFHLECGQPGARMQVTVFDLAGRAIMEFRETDFTGNAGGNPDAYEAAWRIPAKVASGVYIYTVRVKFDATGEYKKVTKKFAIVR